jgi:hypothetical protein
MFIWFPYKTPYLYYPQYNTLLPKFYTHMISYSFPDVTPQARPLGRRLKEIVRCYRFQL